MPRYAGPKPYIDAALKKLDQKTRARLVKTYRIIVPGDTVEVEAVEPIPELRDYEVGEQ